jgi:hypothetical protein
MRWFMTWVDRTPFWLFLLLVATLGLAPFTPEPHLVEKLRWIWQGHPFRPIDVFDLFLHATPWVLLGIKGYRHWRTR